MFPPLSKHQSKNKIPPPTQFELHLSWEHTCVLNDLQAIDLPPFINDSSGKYTKKPSGKSSLLFFWVTQTELTKTLSWIKPIQLPPHLCSCAMGRVGFEDNLLDCTLIFHPHKSREHLYHTISISLSNTYEIKLLNEAHVTVLPWIKSKEENENELCYNKERQLSSRKKKLRRMNEWMYKWKSFLIKGYLTHRNKQKYVRGVRSNPSLIKVYPDYSAGKAAF